ncbi:hypothetical protein DPEC_G00141520 [Dallia pectoralis]|uniref:Uncharacterized protein n=1 Tax=Dallia pectoralis TaxID=75939 RepID=A0ACC2GN13_DALPE|nr:hypothetical protein DPEC_G00141520 [Dallia pectoralis]
MVLSTSRLTNPRFYNWYLISCCRQKKRNMTIVLRLQGLDVEAGTEDIRSFFTDLYIPNGGVCIIGGHLGEAFIAFTTEKDAQFAMQRSGNLLKGSPVTLNISSIAELKRKSGAREKEKHPSALLPERTFLPSPAMPLTDPATALLIGIAAAISGLQSDQPAENNEAEAPGPLIRTDGTAVPEGQVRKQEDTCCLKPSYVRLFGLPESVTKQEVCHFFKGLSVQEIIANAKIGVSHGCLVKFTHAQDACDALGFHHQILGSNTVEVRRASEDMWSYANRQSQNPSYDPLKNPFCRPTAQGVGSLLKSQEISSHTICRDGPSLQLRKRAFKRARLPHRTRRQSLYKPNQEIPRTWAKRCSEDRSLSLSPKRSRPSQPPPPSVEYCIVVKNLTPTIAKTEIKELFSCPHIANSKIIYLLDEESQRTDTVFVVFDQTEDYVYALYLNGCHVGPRAITVSPVTKEEMRTLLSAGRCHDSPKTLPAVSELSKHKMLSNGIGEAVVQFETEDFARCAQQRNGMVYMGTRVQVRCISVQQMEDILK